ncbi:MAG: tetratricopeptide repeat protein [Spirochaetaceae bacterium]|jgi:tetratricopeptide (TPR) repeat protein|nr:tetratricopeptide repeat protein [Spirochaetaceae bacterium]
MKGKKFFENAAAIAVIGLFAFLALGSGTMEGAQKSQGSRGWILDWEKEHETSLGQYEIAYKDNPKSMPEPLETGLFGRANWFLTILNVFDLQDKLNMEQKLQLFDALFNYVPAKTQDEGYRIVTLGGFKNGKALQFVLASVGLNEKAPKGTHGLRIVSNSTVLNTDKGKMFTITELILGTINWSSLGVIFPDGRVIQAGNLSDEKDIEKWKKESGDDQTLLAINLSDLYIKDEIKENDAEAFALLEKALADPIADPAENLAARLNYFLCLLSANRIDEAEKTLDEVTELYQNLPEQSDPGLKLAVELEAPTLLAIHKRSF